MNCRHCRAEVADLFIDLATAPPSNAYLDASGLSAPEKWYPLRVFVCRSCWLVQTEDYAHHGELFSPDYAYFSSYSTSWLKHAEAYVAGAVSRFDLGPSSLVIEVAANDGYLLQYVKARGIPCLGVEPTSSTARAARARGLEVIEEFFGRELAQSLVRQGRSADLMAANNVLAHVPDINDFLGGFAILLKPDGVATFEFPHLLRLVEHCQFDTIYHEHFSYLSLTAVQRMVAAVGLVVFDVEELPTHGGSLRVYVRRADGAPRAASAAVGRVLEMERSAGVPTLDYYRGFQARADRIKDDLVAFLIEAKRRGHQVAAYGAAAKGNTLLNYAGLRGDLIAYVTDRSPAKQGRFLPGSRLPIHDPEEIRRTRPRYVLVLPWNLREEIVGQLSFIREWGGQFVIAVPALEIV